MDEADPWTPYSVKCGLRQATSLHSSKVEAETPLLVAKKQRVLEVEEAPPALVGVVVVEPVLEAVVEVHVDEAEPGGEAAVVGRETYGEAEPSTSHHPLKNRPAGIVESEELQAAWVEADDFAVAAVDSEEEEASLLESVALQLEARLPEVQCNGTGRSHRRLLLLQENGLVVAQAGEGVRHEEPLQKDDSELAAVEVEVQHEGLMEVVVGCHAV
jgi:hypothetical protein